MTSIGMDKALKLLLNKASGEVIDYGFVMDSLSHYANPRVKLNHLIKIGAIIRIKKGLYIFGPQFAKQPYSGLVLANMIYGPSYISLDWAAQYYHLIPERVTTYTSIACKRSKQFNTPVGTFSYDHVPEAEFSVGVTLLLIGKSYVRIATKEKTLSDLLYLRRGRQRSKKHFEETLFEDLRVEEEDIKELDLDLLQEIYSVRPHSSLKYLIATIQEMNRA